MERCPNCAARLGEGPNCRRCGMDLNRLLETEQAAEQALTLGMRHLLDGDDERAREALARSLALRDTSLTRELRCFLEGFDPANSPDDPADQMDPDPALPMPQETAEPERAWGLPNDDTASSGAPPMGIGSFPTR